MNHALPWPQFGMFTDKFETADALLAFCQPLGLRHVQLAGPLLARATEEPAFAETLSSQLRGAGITVVGLAGYRNLVSPDPAKKEANLQFIERCLEVAPRLGCRAVATETGTKNPSSDWIPDPANALPAAWGELLAVLDRLLAVADRHGTELALEGYVNNILGSLAQLADLFGRYADAPLRLVCDPYNYIRKEMIGSQGAVFDEFASRYADRFVIAHLKDVGPDGAEASTPEFGTGVFDQRRYLRFLRDRRPDLALVQEHLPPDHLPAAIERARRCLP